MKTFLFALLNMLFLGGCAGGSSEPFIQNNLGFIPYEEVWQRAESLPVVTVTLGQLGTQRAGTHERIISDHWRGYLCLDRILQTPRGSIDAALCVPDWYKRIYPASTPVRFVYQADITQRMPLHRVLYIEVSNLRYR